MYKHCIVGGGPVGLTLALMLKKFNIPFLLIEKRNSMSAHPSAHYINLRTREIFSQIDGLNQEIDNLTENIEYFKNYSYTRRIGEQPMIQINQFAPNIQDKFYSLRKYSFATPVHLPQNLLVECLSKNLLNGLDNSRSQVLMGQKIIDLQEQNGKYNIVIQGQNGQNSSFISEYVYGCDGLNGFIRQKIGSQLIGERYIQNFLNVHFESPILMKAVLSTKSMLTFIYNSDIVAVLIAHQISSGTFALQVPLDLIMPKYSKENLAKIEEGQIIQMINNLITSDIHPNDIKVKSIGVWRMGAVVANNYFKGKVILVGDAAHSLPPAGGFGLNTGASDAHNLAHKLKHLHDENYNENLLKLLLESYQFERKEIVHNNIQLSMKYYQRSLDIARTIGYDYKLLKTYQSRKKILFILKDIINNLSSLTNIFENIYTKGLNIGSKVFDNQIHYQRSIKLLNELNAQEPGLIPLIFPNEEACYKYSKNEYLDEDGSVEKKLVGLLLPNWETEQHDGLKQYISQNNQSLWTILLFKPLNTNIIERKLRDKFYYLRNVNFQILSTSLKGLQKDQESILDCFILVRPDLHIFGVYKI